MEKKKKTEPKTEFKTEFNSTDRMPPQNVEAEQSVLGSLMIDKNAVIKIADFITPEDFYKDSHNKIFEAMLYLYEKHEPIDLLSLSNRLKETDHLERIGGHSYLASLANTVPTAANIVHYAKIVEKKAILRKLIDSASQIIGNAYDEKNEVDEVLDLAEQKIFSVSQKHIRQDFTAVKPMLEEAFERIDDLSKNKGQLRGVPTGFRDLDSLLSGLQESNLVILGARPSMGKSSFAMDIARQAAVKHKVPVGIFSLEMSKSEVIDRLICSQAHVDLWKMRTGNLSSNGENDDFSRIGHAIGTLSEAPLFIDDTAGLNVMEMRTMARRLQAEHGLGLLVIDYLQLIEGRANIENRVQVVSEISRSLKGLARELRIPIIALSQLSRGVESRDDQKPKLSDLRESGSIEQDADVVMFIYREDRAKRSEEKTGIADIIIAKHRNGPIGEIQLYFKQEYTSFVDMDVQHSEQ
ncbi:MAG: replicative DNA helicase [Candidatus Pacebacteria bacterium]|nr:replicative DNA helicase [Candidatus Paceibacterota bacterium]